MKPFVVTSLQAIKMPRWLLLALCTLYVVPGLLGRDPWRFADAAGFGISWTMAQGAHGATDWLLPNVVGLPMTDTGPGPFWLGALAMKALPFLPADTAMRLTALCWLVLLLCSVWYASWLLAGRTEMQPADPFGASASRIDFGRSMADCALLIMLATLGLLERSHETTAHSAQIAWVGVFLFGCARALERPKLGGAIAGVAIGLTVLTRGIPTAVVLALTAALATALSRPYRLVAWPMLSAMTLAALATALPWPLALGHADWIGLADPVAALNHRAAWLARNAGQLSWPTAASWSNLLRNLPWFFWPAWPIAAWAVWQWRSQRLAAAVALPAACTAGLLMLAVFSTGASEVALLPVIAPMAMLAALGVPALRRGISSLIDWFAVMSFSLIGLALWAYWLAFMTGWPPRMALSAQRAVRGFMPILDPLEALLGLAATIAWIVLVYWRVSRQPRALWRTVALSSGGLVLTWFLLMTLWLPAANFRNTYRDVAQQAGAAIPGGYRCIRTLGLDAAHRASFAYFGAMRLDDVRPDCDWLLLAERIDSPMAIESIPGAWHEAWSGQRPADRRERFRLLKRRAQ